MERRSEEARSLAAVSVRRDDGGEDRVAADEQRGSELGGGGQGGQNEKRG